MSMEKERRAQWLRGVLDLCVLAILSDRECYGYELAQQLEKTGLGKVKGGTLYPLLARLEKASLVATEWRPGEQGPGRKYYTLTPAGRKTLRLQGAQWQDFARAVGTLMNQGE
jgi:PadR family transcriptional regulator